MKLALKYCDLIVLQFLFVLFLYKTETPVILLAIILPPKEMEG